MSKLIYLMKAALEASLALLLRCTEIHCRPVKLTASDKFHLTKFLRFMDMENNREIILAATYTEGFTQNLHRVLLNTPDILTQRYTHSNTVLHCACILNTVALVQHLPEFEALLNVKNSFGFTPLALALKNNA